MARTVSLIITVLNEERTIGPLLESILAQSRPPDEVVICDAGSRDRTGAIINDYMARGLKARVLVEPGANRSRARNLAIREASGEVIASTDGGCVADVEWLARLTAPFEEQTPPEVVCGYYRAAAGSLTEEAVAAATVPDVSEVDADAFLPSGRSVAFLKQAWERVGGYPENVPFAEDTAFGTRLRAAGCEFRFVGNAVVRWHMQASAGAVFWQFYRYAVSDGELGHWFGHYAKAFFGLVIVALVALLSVTKPWILVSLPGLLLAYWTRYTLRAWRRGASWRAGLLSPVFSLVVDLANLSGYTVGRLRRRPVPNPLPTDRALSVAQITYTYQPIAGGADTYVSQLANLVTAAGHQSTVYQRTTDTTEPEVRFVPNPFRGRRLEFWTQALGLVGLRRELLGHDLLICHYPHYLLALYSLSWPRKWPTRVAISHGVFWDDASGAVRSRMKAWITSLAFRRAHLYIGNDTEFLRAMGIPIAPQQGMYSEVAPGVWFIPNGVDPEKFRPSEPIPEIAAMNPVLVPRNLFRNRGIHLAIEAFEIFHHQFPDTKLLIVGGGGEPEYVADMHRRIIHRGLTETVFFHGPARHEDMPAIYSSAQLTLIPSLCGEGTSVAALESMACGTATICTEVAGLKDLPGPHARPTPVGLAEVMGEVYPDRRRIGEEQRRQVVEQYSIEKWRRAWQEALDRVARVGEP